jgi:antitoxin (DNA-binding transcriptional repressor) of toxin-antitoxin stability system
MKTVGLEEVTFDTCVAAAQKERVLVTRDGKPVALILGIEGMDREDLQLAGSAKFWELIDQRRKQKTISRVELEQRLDHSE